MRLLARVARSEDGRIRCPETLFTSPALALRLEIKLAIFLHQAGPIDVVCRVTLKEMHLPGEFGAVDSGRLRGPASLYYFHLRAGGPALLHRYLRP